MLGMCGVRGGGGGEWIAEAGRVGTGHSYEC